MARSSSNIRYVSGIMLNKKTTLFVSFFLSVVLVIWDYFGNYQLCGGKEWGGCVDILAGIETIFLLSIPVFVFSSITYWMKGEVYRAWFRFARWWIPLSIILIFLSPEYSSDWILPIVKGTVAFAMSALFVIIYTILIIWKYWRLNKTSRT